MRNILLKLALTLQANLKKKNIKEVAMIDYTELDKKLNDLQDNVDANFVDICARMVRVSNIKNGADCRLVLEDFFDAQEKILSHIEYIRQYRKDFDGANMDEYVGMSVNITKFILGHDEKR